MRYIRREASAGRCRHGSEGRTSRKSRAWVSTNTLTGAWRCHNVQWQKTDFSEQSRCIVSRMIQLKYSLQRKVKNQDCLQLLSQSDLFCLRKRSRTVTYVHVDRRFTCVSASSAEASGLVQVAEGVAAAPPRSS